MNEVENPLKESLLYQAAILCMESAIDARLHMDRSRIVCSELHARRERFETARERVKSGASVSELGLLLSDITWARKQGNRVKNSEDWVKRLHEAEEEIKKHESASA